LDVNQLADFHLQKVSGFFIGNQLQVEIMVRVLEYCFNTGNNLKINDGDYVVFEKVDTPNQFILEGKIVVAVINGLATIKVFKKVEKDVIGLFPHSTNKMHQPIFIARCGGTVRRIVQAQRATYFCVGCQRR